MAKTRSEINNAYAKKAYDDIRLQVSKGQKEIIRQYATEHGYNSLQKFIQDAINEKMRKED